MRELFWIGVNGASIRNILEFFQTKMNESNGKVYKNRSRFFYKTEIVEYSNIQVEKSLKSQKSWSHLTQTKIHHHSRQLIAKSVSNQSSRPHRFLHTQLLRRFSALLIIFPAVCVTWQLSVIWTWISIWMHWNKSTKLNNYAIRIFLCVFSNGCNVCSMHNEAHTFGKN